QRRSQLLDRASERSPARALLTGFDGSNVWVADVAAGTFLRLGAFGDVTQTVTVGSNPHGATFDGSNLWVTKSSGTVSVVRDSKGAVLATLTGFVSPFGAAFGRRARSHRGLPRERRITLEGGRPYLAGVRLDGRRDGTIRGLQRRRQLLDRPPQRRDAREVLESSRARRVALQSAGERAGRPVGGRQRERVRRVRRVHPGLGAALLVVRGGARGPSAGRQLGDRVHRPARPHRGDGPREDRGVRARAAARRPRGFARAAGRRVPRGARDHADLRRARGWLRGDGRAARPGRGSRLRPAPRGSGPGLGR